MSHKLSTFTSQIGHPLNTHNAIVVIPKLKDIQILATEFPFPSERMQNYTEYFQGERVKFPSLPTNGGEWQCSMPEGELMKVRDAYMALYRTMYTQDAGTFHFWSMRDKMDIEVYARTMNGDVNGSEKLFGRRLMGAFMVGPADVNLSASNATQHWLWNITFSYDWIQDIDSETSPPTY